MTRFGRGALARPNVRRVIFSDDPINDLGGYPALIPSFEQLVAGIRRIAR